MTRMFLAALLAAQALITPPGNKYSPEEDVKLGQQAASQVERQMPIMRDDEVNSYIEGVGRRLVDAIPPSLTHPEFHYTFAVVNVREINAFALPGGPMFVNRGMIEAAHTEGEVAGVMAHEISHVVLRHDKPAGRQSLLSDWRRAARRVPRLRARLPPRGRLITDS